jgi:hypothetical protein
MALSKQQQDIAISMWENHQCAAKDIADSMGVSAQEVHLLLGARCCTYMASLAPQPAGYLDQQFEEDKIVPDVVLRQVKAQMFATALAPASFTDKWIKQRALERVMDIAVEERSPKKAMARGEGQVSVHVHNNTINSFAEAINKASDKVAERFKALKAAHCEPALPEPKVQQQLSNHIVEIQDGN